MPSLTAADFYKRALALCVVLLGLLTSATTVAKAGSCGSAAKAWSTHCSAVQHMKVTPVFCVGDRATFQLETTGVQPLRVEISRNRSGAMQAVPIGDFPHWNEVPAPRRALLDKVRACVQAGFDPAAFKPVELKLRARQVETGTPRLPWLAVLATLLGAIVVVLLAHSVHRRRCIELLVAGCALTLVAFVFRRALFPPAFFHQNGQGPDWINYALGVSSGYGPGFFQFFGLAARLHPERAEQAVFLQAGLLAAAEPLCVLAIARASGARWLLAGTLALATLVAPGLARLANSETYFGVCTALLLLAGAVLATGARSGRLRSWSFGLAVASAGLFIAQAALVHPVCWVPAALLPVVVFTGRGSLRRRTRLAIASAVGIAIVVVAATGGFLFHQAHSQARWTQRTAVILPHMWPPVARLAALAIVVAAFLWFRGRRRSAASWVLLLPVLLAVGLFSGRTLGAGLPLSINWGWWALELPAGVATASALLGLLGRAVSKRHTEAIVAATTAVALSVWFAASWRSLRELPTDALEARFVESWRSTLPPSSSVAYLSRVQPSITTIPVYGCCDPRHIEVHQLSVRDSDTPLVLKRYAQLVREDRPVYYYRSSLCSTPAGAAECTAIERRLSLQIMAHSWLPARPSAPWIRYRDSRVEVGLFRVRDVHQ